MSKSSETSYPNVHLSVLEKLKCCVCEGYLSTPPIYQHETKTNYVCGRCSVPVGYYTRAELYETLAEMMSFPCKNDEVGCKENIPFKNQAAHDLVCEFRSYECPVTLDASCEWIGAKKKILEHCEQCHPQKVVLLNPSTMKSNITKNSFQAFLITAFGELFLLHIKVCMNSKKVYHSLRYVGDNTDVKYAFKVTICSGNEKITKTSVVAPQDTLKFNSETGVLVCISSLLDVFGDFEEFLSRVTIYTRCVKCNETFKKLVFHVEMGWICNGCVPIRPNLKDGSKSNEPIFRFGTQ